MWRYALAQIHSRIILVVSMTLMAGQLAKAFKQEAVCDEIPYDMFFPGGKDRETQFLAGSVPAPTVATASHLHARSQIHKFVFGGKGEDKRNK